MFSTVSFHFKVIQTRVPNARTGRTVIHTEGRGILPSYYIKPETHNRRDGGHGKNLRDEVDGMQNVLRIFEVGNPPWRCRSCTLLHLGHLGRCMLNWQKENVMRKEASWLYRSTLRSDQLQSCY